MSLLQQHNSFSSDPKPSIPEQDNLYSNPEVGTSLQNGDTSINKSIVRRALESVIKERAVLYSRAPAWHKFNTVGANVKLRDDSNNISISPLVCKGLAADFNGDGQIGYVIILLPKNKESQGLIADFLKLTKASNLNVIKRMFYNINIPTFNSEENEIAVVDLYNFPHTSVRGINPDGKNGPIVFHNVIPGTKVIAFDETTGKPIWADVDSWSVHPDRQIEIVNLSHGYQIITDDDPRAVYGIDPNLEGYQFVRCTPTEALERKLIVPRVSVLSDLNNEDVVQEIDFAGVKLAADENLGYFLGVMSGDGWVTTKENNNFYIADLEGANALKVKSYVETWIPDLVYKTYKQEKTNDANRYGDSVQHRFTSSTMGKAISCDLKKLMDGHRDETTSGCGNKHVPYFIFSSSKECIYGYLAGIFDTDGTICISKAKAKKTSQLAASITSTSLQLLRDIKLLLSMVGIQARISFSKVTAKGNDAWLLVCSSIDFYNKGKYIVDRMATTHKKVKFFEAEKPNEDSANMGRYNLLPITKSLQKLIKAVVPTPKSNKSTIERASEERKQFIKDFTSFNMGLSHTYFPRNVFPKLKVKQLLELMSKYAKDFKQDIKVLLDNAEFQKLVQLSNAENIMWLEIQDIEKTAQIETVYDLTVPGYETFVNSDGVVLSNTINVHVPATSGAQSDLKKKLFPDKQIFSGRDNRNIVNPITQEFLLGLWNANRKPGNKYQFRTKEEALAAIKRGAIRLNDDVEITG